MSELYKLLNMYELFVNDMEAVCRVEVFGSLTTHNKFRTRVWLQKPYNLYPSSVNTGAKGEDLHLMHSSDQLLQEITSLLNLDVAYSEGGVFKNESSFLKNILEKVETFFS